MSRPRDVRAIALARLISEMGDEIALIALLFRVKSSGAAAISAIFALYALSRIVLSPFSGTIVDRYPSRRLITTVSLVQTVTAVCLALSDGLLLFVLVFVLAVGASIIGPAWQSLVPTLVPAEDLSRTYAFIQAHRSMAIVLGAGLGGYLVELFGSSVSLMIDAATFLVVALLGATLVNERPRGLSRVSGRESIRGFRSILSTPVLLASIIMLAAFNMSAGVNEVLGIFLVTDVLDGSASHYGLIMSSLGASMVVSGFVLSRVTIRRPDTQMLVLSALMSALGMLAYGLSPSVWFAMIAFAINGAGLTGLHAFATPLIVRHTSEDERGRVFAASSSVTTGGTLISTGIAGSVGQVLPIRTVISGAAIACAVCVALAGRSISRADRGERSI